MSTPQLFVGLCCAAQLTVFSYLQFGYHVQTLGMPLFLLHHLRRPGCRPGGAAGGDIRSSSWPHKVLRWLPALLVLAVPLCYEIDPKVPAFGWWPTGAVLAAVPLAAALVMRLRRTGALASSAPRTGIVVAVALSIVGTTGALLRAHSGATSLDPDADGITLPGRSCLELRHRPRRQCQQARRLVPRERRATRLRRRPQLQR